MEKENIILKRNGEKVNAEISINSTETLLGFLSTLFEALMQVEDIDGKKRILKYIHITSIDAFTECMNKENNNGK